jgi:hypothetical protein
MPSLGLICSQCNDEADVVTPLNGSTLVARMVTGEVIVALHARCAGTWADKNDCATLVPLKNMRRRNESNWTPGSVVPGTAVILG